MDAIKKLRVTKDSDRAFEVVLKYFKNALVDGSIQAGDRLLSERDLAAQFQIGRGSLREAMRAMEMMGILSVVSGKGTFIMRPEPHSLADVFGVALSLRSTIYESILEVRKIIECEAVRLACKRSTPEELLHIKNSLSKMQNASIDNDLGTAAAQADFEFHEGIIKATHNDFLIFLYEVIEVLLRRNHAERWMELIKIVPGSIKVAARYHETIYEAIAIGDEANASDIMRSHFLVLDAVKEKAP